MSGLKFFNISKDVPVAIIVKTYTFDDNEIIKLEEMVLDEYLDQEEKIYMHFALGKAYEDISDYKKSFNHYKQGNDLKLPYTKYKTKDFTNECINQIEICTSDLFEVKNNWDIFLRKVIVITALVKTVGVVFGIKGII